MRRKEARPVKTADLVVLCIVVFPYMTLTSGCASKRYTDQTTASIRQRVEEVARSNSEALAEVRSTVEKMRGGRAHALEFLPSTVSEESGFGLYSYVLFGRKPSPATRERYLAVLKVVCLEVQPLAKMATVASRDILNVTYVPVDTTVPKNAAAEWVLEHYDHGRSEALIAALPQRFKKGPVEIMLISSQRPLNPRQPPALPLLVQNLSSVTPSIAGMWVDYFLARASRPNFWEEDALDKMAYRLRATIEAATIHIEEVKTAAVKLGFRDLAAALMAWIVSE